MQKFNPKSNLMPRVFIISISVFCLWVTLGFSQTVNFTLDVTGRTKQTPPLLKMPGINLSGRGFHKDPTWPNNLAAPEAIAYLGEKLELQGGLFRIQFNLWEFIQLAKNKQMQAQLLDNYSEVIKGINAAGGIVILNLYGMPPGLGKVLDQKSSPWDIKAFKEIVEEIMHYFSCQKQYNVWYEVWRAPDLEDFFLGQQQEYFRIYQAVAESAKNLKKDAKRKIPVGGPGSSWWFQNSAGNTAFSPERSIIYELIRFCVQRKLPLDFISWNAYTSDPLADREVTIYKKTTPELIRSWLSYFGKDSTIPLIISEWNYDAGLNFEPKRGWASHVSASFIPNRLRNMLRAGIDYQIFFCLEDFKKNAAGVNQNVGLFWFEPEYEDYAGGPKSTFNVMRMLNMLGSELFFSSPPEDDFFGVFATKTSSGFALLFFNYIDPHIARSQLTRNITRLHPKQAKILANLVHSKEWENIINKEVSLDSLRLDKRVRSRLKEAIVLKEKAQFAASNSRSISLNLTNLEGDYIYRKYLVDDSCRLDCEFVPTEEKELKASGDYKEELVLKPYSVALLVLEKKQTILPDSPQPDLKADTEKGEIKDDVAR